MTKVDVLKGSVATTLFYLSAPMVLGIIAILSINLTDTYFLGKLGTLQLAAISFTFPVVFTLTSLAIGIGAGTSSVVSRAYGSKNIDKVKNLATHSLILAFILVSFVCAAGLMTIEPLFEALGASSQTLPFIKDYMEVWYLGTPFLVIPMVANNIIRAGGDTATPSVIMIFAAIINVALDPILIFGWGPFQEMGMQGAAWASVASRFSTFVFSISIVVFKEQLISLSNFTFKEVMSSWAEVLKIGVPASLGNMANPIAIGVVTNLAAEHGPSAVAGLGVSTRIEAFLAIPLLALSAAISPFAGQNYGAGQHLRLKKALQISSVFSLTWAACLFITCYLGGDFIASLFSQNPEVIDFSSHYLKWISFSLFGYGILIVSASTLNATDNAKIGLSIYAMRAFVFYVPFAYFASQSFGKSGLAVGIAAANTVTGVLVFFYMRRLIKSWRS
jgi:putative MATE family efflux protein